jgi:uncharacterized protein (DUF58 family)
VAAARLAQPESALLDAVRTLRWPARRKSPAGLVGAHLSPVLGTSAEFTEYRAYRQGDETRRIDWKLLARSNRAYIRLSNERTVLSTTVLVDASGSLAYPADTLEKWHHARLLVMGLAAVAHAGGDPVGLLVPAADGVRRLPPRSRRGVVHEIVNILSAITPAGSQPLAPLLSTLRAAGRVVIVSDFLGDADELCAIASQLAAAGREVHAVHVLHANEVDPPRNTSLLTDPENPEFKRPITERTRRRYLETFGAWREKLARDWRMAGTYYSAVSTDEPVARAVRRIVLPPAARLAGR